MTTRGASDSFFEDRSAAGRRLGLRLRYLVEESPVVLALPRGGVPVASEVARALRAPLDLVLVRKIATPGVPSGCLGTVSEGGVYWFDEDQVQRLHIRPFELQERVERERQELEGQERRYMAGRPRIELEGRFVIIVDDGAATGRTAQVAIRAVKAKDPSRVVFAAGVISRDAFRALEEEADDVVAAVLPSHFHSIRDFYRQYPEVTDDEVERLLLEARDLHEAPPFPPA